MELKARNKKHLIELLDEIKYLVEYMDERTEYVITLNESKITVTSQANTRTNSTGWYRYPNGERIC